MSRPYLSLAAATASACTTSIFSSLSVSCEAAARSRSVSADLAVARPPSAVRPRREGALSFTLQAAGLIFVATLAYATVRVVLTDTPHPASPKQETRQAAVLAAKLAPEPSGATMQEFNRLQTGMTISDVNRIIGCPGTELSRAEFGGSSTVMFMWEGTGSWLGNMNATFQDGRLMAKAQMGLEVAPVSE